MRSLSPARRRRRATATLALVAITAALGTGTAQAAAYERILNGTFASGTADPWWASAGVTNRVVGGELCASVTGGTTNPWDALIGQNGVPFEAGQQYTMSFDAYATTPQSIAANAGEAVSPYRGIARHEVQLTTSKQKYTFTFTSELDFPDLGNGQITFQLGGNAANNTVCVDNVSLVGGVIPPGGPGAPTKKVQVDQVAYVPGLPKHATLVSDTTTAQTWSLKNSAGTTVATGQTTPKGVDTLSGDPVHLIDFSSYDTAGTGYTLTVGAESSFPFDISADAMKKLRYDSLAFFYHQRSGVEIQAQYVGATYARPAGHVNVAPNQGDNNVPCRSDLNCGYTLDVRGGWYDAGDHGKYVVNGGISAWQVLNTYERAKLIGDAAALGDGKLSIPEQANGVPDVLDEARWEVEFLLKMQAPDGMVHHKIHDANWTALPTLPHQDSQVRRLSATSTAATLNMAAVAAQAARIWKTIDPAFADKALAAAKKAYAAAKANPNKIADPNDGTGGGAYSDTTLTDEFYWAAAEMYTTTGETSYRADVTGSSLYKGQSLNDRGYDWGATGPLGDITLALVPNGLPAQDVAAIKAAFVATADKHLNQMASQGYPAPYREPDGTYVWGSNGLIANNASVLALAHDFTGAAKYREGVFQAMHYLLGRNPVSYSYVSGYGEQPVKNVHHRHWANQLDQTLPIAPPGALSGGPNSALQDPVATRLLQGCKPQKCFVDHIEAYSLNEVTVNWNSALAWIANWAAEKSGPSVPPDNTPPTTPGTPVASGVTGTGVTLNWTASSDSESGVRGYDVISIEGDTQRVVTTVTGTSATLTGLSPNTTYRLAVKARNGAGLTSALSGTVSVTTTSDGQTSCKITYQANGWSNGLSATVTITNTSSAEWSSWTLGFTWPGNQKVTHGWSATWTQTAAAVTATSMSWNGRVPAGGSVQTGFNASSTAPHAEPTGFTVNGQACSKG
ncbi:glycoside hydrolase family 9 protein [Kibdelosporangium persicum]|uniref:Endoglucanase n=1 Tax=Kibdelosporangium persicum TaxID=2698649 RepID=A0ABX2F535_9PSEU|nr:glycoside hydrolase family 9 protein [Kibdelosporangium persicum]NRN66454.1 Non-processive endocellulase [Kibdelosporangium persicum]